MTTLSVARCCVVNKFVSSKMLITMLVFMNIGGSDKS
jgi:hypothetical protein